MEGTNAVTQERPQRFFLWVTGAVKTDTDKPKETTAMGKRWMTR